MPVQTAKPMMINVQIAKPTAYNNDACINSKTSDDECAKTNDDECTGRKTSNTYVFMER